VSDCAPARSLHALVNGLVDYAGLFPPAALTMQDAVVKYAAYGRTPESWLLGRLVVPIARLEETADAAAPHLNAREEPWRLAVTLGDNVSDSAHRVTSFNATHAGRLVVDVVEAKISTTADIERVARAVGQLATVYLETPVAGDPRKLLSAVRDAGARAKVRTGGVTPDAFPTASALARFIVHCAELGLAFKATAGLHHPIRSDYRLTYEGGSPHATMFGFLNVFAAAVFARSGMQETALVRVLDESDVSAFRFDGEALHWRGRSLALERIVEARAAFAISFGSCSFREPVADLQQLRLL
jgi:hypothetical protein